MRRLFLLPALLLFVATAAGAEERLVDTETRRDLAVVAWPGDLGLVAETRTVDLDQGETVLRLTGVSARLLPEALFFAPAGDDDGFEVGLRAFRPASLSPRALLERALGRTVRLVTGNPATGEETVEDAVVLSATGPVLRLGDRIETAPAGRIVFDAVPDDLRALPDVMVQVTAPVAGTRSARLVYLTGGIGWRADWTGVLDRQAGTLDLALAATVTNATGIDLPQARLRLVAGQPNRVGSMPEMPEGAVMARAMIQDGAAVAPASLYHVFTVDRPVTLVDGGAVQIPLLRADGVPVSREYRAEAWVGGGREPGEQPLPVTLHLSFDNDEASGPGGPLPAGIVRLFAAGPDGPGLFIGEDRLPDTPVGREVRLSPGTSFDVTATRRQTDFLRRGLDERVSESAWEIGFANAEAGAVTVIFAARMLGDWEIMEETAGHARADAGTAEWAITVPAGGTAALSFRARLHR